MNTRQLSALGLVQFLWRAGWFHCYQRGPPSKDRAAPQVLGLFLLGMLRGARDVSMTRQYIAATETNIRGIRCDCRVAGTSRFTRCRVTIVAFHSLDLSRESLDPGSNGPRWDNDIVYCPSVRNVPPLDMGIEPRRFPAGTDLTKRNLPG